jgi:hypothetical protein
VHLRAVYLPALCHRCHGHRTYVCEGTAPDATDVKVASRASLGMTPVSDVTPIRSFRGYHPDDPLHSPTVEELQRLRCPDGHPYVFHRIGSRPTGVPSPVADAIELRCYGGHDRRIIYISLYERSLWERVAPPLPEGLKRGEPSGIGDIHRRHIDFPRSLRATTTDAVWFMDPHVPEVRAHAAVPFLRTDDDWYTGSAYVVGCPGIGGLKVGTTIPSLADAAALRHAMVMAVIASSVRWFVPHAVPVGPPAQDDLEESKALAPAFAAHFGWTTYAPVSASLVPDPAGPQEAIAIESGSGPWTGENLVRQAWEPLVVGWDRVGDGRALLFPDYDGEGDAFGARTVAWLLRAGVPQSRLTRRRGWFQQLPFSEYGQGIDAVNTALGGHDSARFPVGPVIDATLTSLRAAGEVVPDDWQSEWNRLVGYDAR